MENVEIKGTKDVCAATLCAYFNHEKLAIRDAIADLL